MRTTFKVAELATIIYAILVFGSLCVEMAYFSTFGIAISSYLGPSEILLSFLTKPLMYLPSLVVLVLPYFIPDLRLNSLSRTSFRQRNRAFAWYSYILITVNVLAILAVSSFYKVDYSAGGIIACLGLLLLLILPNTYMSDTRNMLREAIRHSVYNIKKAFKCSTDKSGNDTTKKPVFSRTVSKIKISRYKYAKHKLQIINMFCENALLYNIILSYTIMIIGLSAINYSRACAYIDKDIDPPTKMEVTTPTVTYICDNEQHSYIGESVGFIFIYDRVAQETLVLPREQILQSSYAVSERNLRVKRHLETKDDEE